MTLTAMRPRLWLFALLFASPLAAQDTAQVRTISVKQKALADSIAKRSTSATIDRQAARMKRLADSALVAAQIVVVAPTPVPTPTPTPTPVPTPTPTPGPSPTKVGPATVAELPRSEPNPAFPALGRQVRIGANLQAALDTAKSGDILVCTPGASYVGNFTLPDRGNATWIVVMTDATIGSGRMTPSKAAALKLCRIQTPNNAPAIQTALTAHHWRLTGLDVGGTSTASEINGIVKLGEGDRAIQTSLALTAHDLIIDRSYIHGTPTQAVHRCVNLQSATTTIVDSWISECHSNNGDSQAIIGWNGPGPYLIQNNHLEGGHQGVFFGGADPARVDLTPADITVRGNHITRPASWYRKVKDVYGPGEWQTKTIIETKNVRRMLVEGNVIENVWADAQAGFGVLLKSENQLCSAPYSQTSDVTIRYNRFRNMASGFNIAGHAGDCPTVAAARFTIHDNVIEAFNATGDGIPLQLLSGAEDVVFAHNTFATAGNASIAFSGPPTARAAIHSGVFPVGQYGVKGDGQGTGNTTIAAYLPGALFANNVIIGTEPLGTGCLNYPAGTLCPASALSVYPVGYDGKPIGADAAKVNAATAGVEVAP